MADNPYNTIDPPKPLPPPANPYDVIDPRTEQSSSIQHAGPVWSGSVLPVSQYPGQPPQLDWNAGITGQIKSAFTLPSDVMTGQLQLGSPESISRLTGAAMFASPMAPGVTSVSKAAVPSIDALHDVSSTQYDAARGLGVHYTVPSVVDWAKNTAQSLYESGFHPVTQPKTFGLLDSLTNPPKDAVSVPLAGVESAAQVLSKIAADKMDSERFAAGQAHSSFHDFMENPAPGTVVSGDAEKAAQLLQAGRENWGAAKRSEKLTTAEGAAELQTRPTGDALRGYLRTLLDPRNPQRLAGFSPEEQQAISAFVKGTRTQNLLGPIGRTFVGTGNEVKPLWAILGEQIGQHAGESIPAAVAGLAAPWTIGKGVNTLREALAARQFRNLDEMIRSRSPEYQATSGAPVRGMTPWELAAERGTIGAAGLIDPRIKPVVTPPQGPAYPGSPVRQIFD